MAIGRKAIMIGLIAGAAGSGLVKGFQKSGGPTAIGNMVANDPNYINSVFSARLNKAARGPQPVPNPAFGLYYNGQNIPKPDTSGNIVLGMYNLNGPFSRG